MFNAIYNKYKLLRAWYAERLRRN